MYDLRDAMRALRATPVVSAAAVLTLALSAGATTAIFSILNGLMLRALPVREPATLFALANPAGEDAELDYPVWTAIRERHLLDRAAAWAKDGLTEVQNGQTLPVNALWTSGPFFDTLGVTAVAGRTLSELDDRSGGGPAAVITAAYWKRRFAADPNVVGRSIVLDRVPFTVVGVAAPGFFGLEVGTRVDVILPLEAEPLLARQPSRLQQWPWLHVIGRVPSGSSRDALTAAIRAAQPDIRRQSMPAFEHAEDRDAYLRDPWILHPAGAGNSRLRSRYGTALTTLLLIAALVLLVGCVNIANLQLARTSARRRSLGVRAALGASRWQVIRPVLTENVLIAAAGTALSLIFAKLSAPLLVAQLATWASTPSLDLPLDWRVLTVATAAGVAAVLLFGIAPVLMAGRASPIEALKRETASERRAWGLRDGVIGVQIAVCIVLVFAAHLFIQSFAALAGRDLGFDRRPVVVAVVDAARSRVPPAGRLALYRRLRDLAATVPGAEHAALSLATPLGSAGVRMTREVSLNAGDIGRDTAPRVLTTLVSPEWFATYGTRMLAGRDFVDADNAGSEPVAIVNDAFARRFFAGASALGQTFVSRRAGNPETLTVVGIVEDAAFTSVRTAVEPTVYRPLAQAANSNVLAASPISISVRSAAGVAPARLHEPLAQRLIAVDRDLSVMPIDVKTQLDAYYVRERLLGWLSAFFGIVGLVLAALGLYGVSTLAVSRRQREIGVRIALGADRRRIARLILGRLAAAWAIGTIVGVLGCVWIGRAVAGLLYGVGGHDPVALTTAVITLLVTCGAAGWRPAWHAAQLDPVVILRDA